MKRLINSDSITLRTGLFYNRKCRMKFLDIVSSQQPLSRTLLKKIKASVKAISQMAFYYCYNCGQGGVRLAMTLKALLSHLPLKRTVLSSSDRVGSWRRSVVKKAGLLIPNFPHSGSERPM